MKSLMTLFTAISLLCVQPNVNNVGPIGDGDVISAATQKTEKSDPDYTGTSMPTSGQMPEIEVGQFGGELLHACGAHFIQPPVTGTIVPVALPDPDEHTTFPLLRPPRA